MAFTPKVWKNSPNTTTKLNAAGLIDLETRLSDYTDTSQDERLNGGSLGIDGEGDVYFDGDGGVTPESPEVSLGLAAITDIVYDDDGNVTSITEGGASVYPGGGTSTFTYDDDGDVETQTLHGETLTFQYDEDKNLIGAVKS